MSARALLLLSPYRCPTQHPLMLGPDEMAAWLNGYTALWHPAALWQAGGPPRVDVPYDHEEPKAGHVYALPEAPPLYLPEDWDQRVRAAGAVAFRAGADRQTTLANLKAALAELPAGDAGPEPLLTLGPDRIAPFFGIGLGYLLQATLSEAMEHENLLEAADFWLDVQQAVAELAGVPFTPPPSPESPGPGTDDFGPPPELSEQVQGGTATTVLPSETEEPVEAWLRPLQTAAGRLLSAREVLYPVTIHLLDLALLDERHPDAPWPGSFEQGLPLNLVASGSLLEQLRSAHPERLAALRGRVDSEQAEVCGGVYVEREDALLPLESQLWNLRKGQAVARELLGREIAVFARKRFAAHPQLPLLLSSSGLTRALLLPSEDAAMPQYQATVVGWPSPDGKQVDAFVRKPYPADSAETFFNLGHYLYKTIREDHAATLVLVHQDRPAATWYHDFVELFHLGPVFGRWTLFSRYFGEVMAGEYTSSPSADEFHTDYLSARVEAAVGSGQWAVGSEEKPAGAAGEEGGAITSSLPTAHCPLPTAPVSGFARHLRLRRRLDTCWTLAALQRGLAGRNDPLRLEDCLTQLEDAVETEGLSPAPDTTALAEELAEAERRTTEALAERLLARATAEQPGWLVLNPCSFTRRVALELDGATGPLPIGGPIKACQIDGDKLRLVAEVPALGFAWIPRSGPAGTPPPVLRMRLADERCVRNEFFEAEVDPTTGGLRAIRDRRTGSNRLGQRLVFNPGSVMQASTVKVTSAGPALGEILTEGALLGERQQLLAKFRQRFRAWLGRPLLELRVEIYPEQPPAGYPWHAYYGARFAWRDERAMLLRGVSGCSAITAHTRPQTPDFLELRAGRQSTVLFPGGLPFHQRHESRMLDVILVPQGESAHVFELGLGLDREHPMQTALGLSTPVPLYAAAKGPPHVGATGWLFHLDTPNLLLTSLRPGGQEVGAGDLTDAVTARLLECGGQSGQAELRCVRDPRRAVLLDARGQRLVEASVQGDAALFEVSPGDFVQLQVEW